MTKKTYTVSLTFTDIQADSPLEATKQIVKWIEDGVNEMVFDVTDEETNDKFTVDLDGEEPTVLPNN